MRKLLLNLHLYTGLIAGIFLVLLSVTGSFMVFEDDVDRALNPKLTWVQPGNKRLSLNEDRKKPSSLRQRTPAEL